MFSIVSHIYTGSQEVKTYFHSVKGSSVTVLSYRECLLSKIINNIRYIFPQKSVYNEYYWELAGFKQRPLEYDAILLFGPQYSKGNSIVIFIGFVTIFL